MFWFWQLLGSSTSRLKVIVYKEGTLPFQCFLLQRLVLFQDILAISINLWPAFTSQRPQYIRRVFKIYERKHAKWKRLAIKRGLMAVIPINKSLSTTEKTQNNSFKQKGFTPPRGMNISLIHCKHIQLNLTLFSVDSVSEWRRATFVMVGLSNTIREGTEI